MDMRNRELGVLIIGILCIALPAVTEWLLPLHGLEPDLGASSMYTEQERMDAAKAVARYCDNELLQLTYPGDGQAARETAYASDSGYKEAIAFRGDFHTGWHAEGNSLPYTTYTDCTWRLGRVDDGGWRVFSSGWG